MHEGLAGTTVRTLLTIKINSEISSDRNQDILEAWEQRGRAVM